jgi:hypothetical protein
MKYIKVFEFEPELLGPPFQPKKWENGKMGNVMGTHWEPNGFLSN